MAWAGGQEIADQIATNIRNSGRLSGYKIAVSFDDGTAQLTGHVRSREQMLAALSVAIETPGVNRVVNKISVVREDTDQTEGKSPTRPSAASQVERASHVADATASSKATGQPRSNRAWSHNSAAQQVGGTGSAPMSRQEASRAILASRGSQSRPIPIAYLQGGPAAEAQSPSAGGPLPMYTAAASHAGVAPLRYDQPCLPNYAWPSYAAYPNYAAVTYPKQYSPTAWPFIGPFYPYPQVPLGWRKVTLEWDDGWWMLDFKDRPSSWEGPLGRWY
jgi:hypothetical protein